jgi:hypothetical protein
VLLTDLLTAIRRANAGKQWLIQGTGGALRYVEASFDSFVPPTFRQDTGDIAHAQVIIVSAPGAVGKSTLAKELAFTCQAPLWDLAADKPIAGHSLAGVLSDTFDDAALEIRQGLKNGSALLVIDALDEARIKTNEASFEAFIGDVAKLARTSQGTSFILLGRTQVAELTWMLLEYSDVQTALLEIEPFDPEIAKHYIDRRVKTRNDLAWERIQAHRGPFEEARDAIFQLLTQTIDGQGVLGHERSVAHDFLGYAPVLDAISELFIGETNYYDLRIRLTQNGGKLASEASERPLSLLRRIVEEILERETRQKLLYNIRPELEKLAAEVNWKSWETLYTPVEQVDRLLARIVGAEYHRDPDTLPPKLAPEYESRLATWLPEHPFLRNDTLANVVFESYVLARSLVAGTASTRALAERYIARPDYRPASLLAEFYFLFTREMGSRQVPVEHLGILYDAMVSAESEAHRLRLSLDGPESMAEGESSLEVDGEFEVLTWSLEDGSMDVLSAWSFTCELSDDSVISFESGLREASIVVPCTVRLGSEGSEFRLGPNVTLRSSHLIMPSKTLVVEAKPLRRVEDDGSVTLEADLCTSNLVERPVVRGQLQVSWPGAEKYPWTEFNTVTTLGAFKSEHLGEAYRRFRRIVQTLRSHSKGSLARFKDKVEHQRVLQGLMGQRLLEQLKEDGVLLEIGEFYHWNPSKASEQVGISWMDLKKWSTSERLTRYLELFIDKNRDIM